MQEQRLITIKPDLNTLHIFLNHVLNCDYGISSNLVEKLSELGKKIEELSIKELNKIGESEFIGALGLLYNLVNDEGEYILPMIYTSCWGALNDELYCLEKFGIQSIDIITKSGKIIYEGAYDLSLYDNNLIVIQSGDSSHSGLYKYDKFQERLDFIIERLPWEPVFFSESKWFYYKGYLSEDFKPATPFCFDDGKEYAEGLAPVCLNGKWGYINHDSEVVIDFQFGDAEIFKNGQAWVFKLNEDYVNKIGEWTTYNSHDFFPKFNFKEEDFSLLFPNFPQKVNKPLCVLRNKFKSQVELIEEYRDFSEGIDNNGLYCLSESQKNRIGKWVVINKKGEIINKTAKRERTNKSDSDQEPEVETDALNTSWEYWLSQIKEHTFKGVYQTPDSLFVNKEFVMKAIKENPCSFENFASKYASDEEVCDLAFKLRVHNFRFFSEKIKERYQAKDQTNKIRAVLIPRYFSTRLANHASNGEDIPEHARQNFSYNLASGLKDKLFEGDRSLKKHIIEYFKDANYLSYIRISEVMILTIKEFNNQVSSDWKEFADYSLTFCEVKNCGDPNQRKIRFDREDFIEYIKDYDELTAPVIRNTTATFRNTTATFRNEENEDDDLPF